MQAEAPLKTFDGDVLVLSGDVPLLSFETVRVLLDFHRRQSAAATVLTCMLEDAGGYGRIVRAADGSVAAIVEQRDATEDQLKIREVNSGIYVFDRSRLFEALRWITPTNAQKEYYLTDVFQYFWKNKIRVSAIAARDSQEVQGINTVQQLDEVRSKMQRIEQQGS
jgi:bifunctional N-acetylglucosamine-1-phosphate-uridyltransferase/glucosamine-1-phosphate-acetyltransferase GlmU-like protein